MKIWMLVFVLLFATFANAQQTITGTVADEQNKPLAGASVFLNNTSIGTKTDQEGRFTLTVPSGRFELIVSSIGYQTATQTINTASALEAFRIVLTIKASELEAVVIEPYEKDGWQKWGTWFIENFIGTSKLAAGCKLKNPEALRFRNSKQKNHLKVVALEPLQIENKELGYRLTYQLEYFTYDFSTRYLSFAGYPFFEPMEGSDRKQRQWELARKDAYFGSLMHFMRSVYRNKILEEGFEVRRMEKRPNVEKQRVQATMRQQALANKNRMVQFASDSGVYYQSVLKQENFTRIVSKDLLPGDSVGYAIDSVTAGLEFDNFLLVQYTRKAAAKEYQNQFPESMGQHLSEITLINQRPIAIMSNGSFFLPNDLLSSGYWAWSEKIATMLPFDYKPDTSVTESRKR
jgi:hypothetical protein